MSDQIWQKVKLGDIAEYVTVGYVGPMTHEYLPVGIPFLRSQEIKPYRIDFTDITYISESFHEKIKKSALQPGDVVIVRTGRPGTSAVIPESLPISNCSDMVVVRPGSNLDSHYLCYYINSIAQDHVSAYSVGAVQQHYNVGSAKDLTLLLPPLPEQRTIARILGALDDKIELNHRMNHTLEEMARSFFKSWFIDFDPVIAKAEGRVPFGMNAETSSLFPAEFEDVRDDAIPRTWEVGSILDFANLLSGGTPSTHKPEYWDGTIAWVSAKDVSSANGLFVLSTERSIAELGLKNSSAKLLPAKTTIVTARGTVGKYCILGREMAMNQTNYGLRAKDGVSNYFTYFSLVFLVEQLQQNSYGTIFDTITTRTFQDSRTIIPSKPVIDAFEKRVTPLMNMILDNALQVQTLTSIRDSLLPKLLSGELRVKQAEKVIENT